AAAEAAPEPPVALDRTKRKTAPPASPRAATAAIAIAAPRDALRGAGACVPPHEPSVGGPIEPSAPALIDATAGGVTDGTTRGGGAGAMTGATPRVRAARSAETRACGGARSAIAEASSATLAKRAFGAAWRHLVTALSSAGGTSGRAVRSGGGPSRIAS